ncbi:MAG: hypothetical protein RL213_265 [Bacteroidota bacterium]
MFYKGDIGGKTTRESIRNHIGFRFGMQLYSADRISLSASYLSGRITANSYDPGRPTNFESVFFSQGLSVRYDFSSRKKQAPVLVPYLSAGVSFFSFRSSTDLKDASGRNYYYWSDGSVRSEAEQGPNASAATVLFRDYEYETDLREANLDGFGKFSQGSLFFPLEAGLTMHLTGHSSVILSAAYNFLGTDLIDGITDESIGARKGDSKNDRLLFAGCAFRFDLTSTRPEPKDGFEHVDFKSLSKEDFDRDGVRDFGDAVTDTAGTSFDGQGRPADKDKDGIPNYRDEEPVSVPKILVDENGITLTDEIQEEKARKSTEAAPADTVYLRPFDPLNPESGDNPAARKKSRLPREYDRLDTDLDGYLSPTEMSKAVNDFNAGRSPYKQKDFYRLIDFYFRQEL